MAKPFVGLTSLVTMVDTPIRSPRAIVEEMEATWIAMRGRERPSHIVVRLTRHVHHWRGRRFVVKASPASITAWWEKPRG